MYQLNQEECLFVFMLMIKIDKIYPFF